MVYTLRNKLIISFVILIVITFSAIALILFNESRAIIGNYIESSAHEKMEEYGSYIEMVQMQVYDSASLIFNSKSVQQWDRILTDEDISQSEKTFANIELSQYLTQVTNSYSSVLNMTIYRDGKAWTSVENLFRRNAHYEEETWYSEFKYNEKYWSRAEQDEVELLKGNPHNVVSMVMPLFTFQAAQATNVLKVNVAESLFLEPLNRIHLGQKGKIYLFDRNGEPLLSEDNYGDMGQIKQYVQAVLDEGFAKGTLYMDKQKRSKDIVVYKKIPKTKWILVGVVPEADLYAELFSLRNTIIIIASVLLIISIGVAIFLSHSIMKPLATLVSAMRHVKRGDFQIAENRIQHEATKRSEIGFVSEVFRSMVFQLRQHIKNEYELNMLKQEAEHKALLMQINPHFLFNTLELMSSLALQNRAKDTVSIINSLGRMMRYSLKIDDNLVLLTDELKYVEHYLNIISVRYQDRVHIEVYKEGDYTSVKVAKFIFQPLLENAVKYSAKMEYSAIVRLSIVRNEESVVIIVEDNGPGFPQEQVQKVEQLLDATSAGSVLTQSKEHIGLANVLLRCKLIYEDEFQYEITKSELNGAKIILTLPIN